MSYVITDSQNYTDIANAIRGKNGSSDTYTPSQMATAITNIPTSTLPTVNVNDCTYLFYGGTNWPLRDCYDFTALGNITSLNSTFRYFSRQDANVIDISEWRVNSNVVMSSMFQGSFKIVDGVYTPFKVILPVIYNPTNVNDMFRESLLHKETNINNIIVGSTMASMFYSCNAPSPYTSTQYTFADTLMRNLVLSSWDTSRVTTLANCFMYFGSNVRDGNSIKIKLDTNLSNVTTVSGLFSQATTVTTIWLGNDSTTWKVSNSRSIFNYTSNLKHVVIRGTNVLNITSSDAFSNSSIAAGTGLIYVPDSLVEDYKAANYWSTYASQIKPISEYVEEDD